MIYIDVVRVIHISTAFDEILQQFLLFSSQCAWRGRFQITHGVSGTSFTGCSSDAEIGHTYMFMSMSYPPGNESISLRKIIDLKVPKGKGCNSFRECKNLVGIHFAHVWIMFFSHLPMSLHKFSWRQLKHVLGNIPCLGIVIQFDDNIVGAHAVPPDFSGHNWGEVFWRPGPACCRCINLGRGWSCWFEWDDWWYSRSGEMVVVKSKGIPPKMPETFRFRNCTNLPR